MEFGKELQDKSAQEFICEEIEEILKHWSPVSLSKTLSKNSSKKSIGINKSKTGDSIQSYSKPSSAKKAPEQEVVDLNLPVIDSIQKSQKSIGSIKAI